MNFFLFNSRKPTDGGTRASTGGSRVKRGLSAAVVAAFALVSGCSDNSYNAGGPTVEPTVPALTTVEVSLSFNTLEIGQVVTLAAKGFDQFGQSIAIGPATFASSNPGVVIVSANTGLTFGIAPGTVDITATVGNKVGHFALTITKPSIRINEVVSNLDVPGGYIELINPSDLPVDLGGWTVMMSDPQNFVVLPSGFIIPAHGYLTVNEINIPHGIASSDAVRLFSHFEVLIDQFDWRGNPQPNFSRCPELDGPFLVRSATRRAANDCATTFAPASQAGGAR